MNIIRLSIAAVICTGPVLAQPPRSGENGPGGDGRSFGRFFEEADANGDGEISREEFAVLERIAQIPEDKREELFRRFDKDGDDKIQRSEMKPPKRPEGGGRPFLRLHQLDSDKDGRVSYEEFKVGDFAKRMPEDRRKLFFERLDTSGDGSLSKEDMPRGKGRSGRGARNHRPPKPGGGRLIETLDKDENGVLDFDEFRRAPWLKDKGEDQQEDQFEELDKNGDLKIEKSELSTKGPGHSRGPQKGPRHRGGEPIPEKPEE